MSTAPVTIAIRRPSRGDAATVAAIHETSWREAYLGILAGRTLDAMLARRGSAKWADAFARSEGYRIIEFGGECAGYSQFGAPRTRQPGVRAEIYEIYLAPEYQGLGLGRKLFAETRSCAARTLGRGLIVWALTENERAAGFYRALGGTPGPTAVEKLGDGRYGKRSWIWK